MHPVVSIIVPVFKAEKCLCRCVDSLLNQTFTDLEILLVDDGSPDNSGEICDEYARTFAHIRVFHKENGGVSSARNLGVKEAKGKYITFIDSDDWVSPSYIEDFEIDKIETARCLILQGIKQFYPSKNCSQVFFCYGAGSFLLQDNPQALYEKKILLNGCPVAKLFVRQVIEDNKISFNEAVSLNEDHLFFLDYLYHIDEIITKQSINYTYVYDFREESLTKSKHSSKESMIVARALYDSINKLLIKYSISLPCNIKGVFGPYQLIRASLSCYDEDNSFANFSRIINEYRRIVRKEELIDAYDFYSESYIYLAHRVGLYPLYFCLLICGKINEGYYKMKFWVKSLIYRN